MSDTTLVVRFTHFGNTVAKVTIKADGTSNLEDTEGLDCPDYIDTKETKGVGWIHDRSQIDDSSPIQVLCGYTDDLPAILFLEETTYRIKVERLSEGLDNDREFSYLRSSGESLESTRSFEGDDDRTCYYFYRSRSYVGKSFLNVVHDGEDIRIPIEIRSKKIGYLHDYPVMLQDIAEHYISMIYRYDSPVFTDLSMSEDGKGFRYEDFMVLEYIFDKMDLPGNFAYISQNRFSELRTVRSLVPAGTVSELDPEGLVMTLCSGNIFEEGDELQFDHVYTTEYREDVDTPENRLVKALLAGVLQLSETLLDIAEKQKNFNETYLYKKLKEIEGETQNMLYEGWMNDVGELTRIPAESSVLQKRHGYRDMFVAYQMLGMGTSLSDSKFPEILEGHNKKIYQIYEYWCYIKLYEALSSMAGDNSPKPLEVNEVGFDISPNTESGTIFDIHIEGLGEIHAELFYNHTFEPGLKWDSTYSVNLRPDYTLLVKLYRDGIQCEYLLNFDAKYKVKNVSDKAKKDEDIDTDCWTFDIYKMHTYRDAILKGCGSYVFYPGNKEHNYNKRKNHDIPSVGAIPMNPGYYSTEYLVSILKRIIRGVTEVHNGCVNLEEFVR